MKTPPKFSRVVIERLTPAIDGGRFPIKRVVGDRIEVKARIFSDGHDVISARLRHRGRDADWTEVPVTPTQADQWQGSFTPNSTGLHEYEIEAWINPFLSWWEIVERKLALNIHDPSEERVAADWLDHLSPKSGSEIAAAIAALRSEPDGGGRFVERLKDQAFREAVDALLPDTVRPGQVARSDRLSVWVDPPLARFSNWYQVFPRSCGEPGRHGSFADLGQRLPVIADMGFNVLYLPPIHPIGEVNRKGRNNSLVAAPGDPGSVWAIGSAAGGHTSIHPELGTLDDFKHLLTRARELGMEIALDITFQCAPDHPYVSEHPDWFARLPDGSIRHAENPPHRYEDVAPFDFECEDWPSLWRELLGIFVFWLEQGVTVFRVDNPHTKPLPFWEWIIGEVKRLCPDAVLLSEGLTRPTLMHHLSKVGFSQAYDYFPWRVTKEELIREYSALQEPSARNHFRPNLWPNTPQCLPRELQQAPPSAFALRLVLAATLGASYGIYGPAYELCVNEPAGPDSIDYADSEQYELKEWDWSPTAGIRPLVTAVNRIRAANPALHTDYSLCFHEVDNPQIVAYSKSTEDRSNAVLTIVNLDPLHIQSGWTGLDLTALGMVGSDRFAVTDLLTQESYHWLGPRNYIELDPERQPAHVLSIQKD